ncbi:MAG TPA: hypothetical protein VH796_10960 [Nitrososphaeraceae archaeon]|jgi:hypothetical protein
MNPDENLDGHGNNDDSSSSNSSVTRTEHSRLDIVTSMDDFIFQILKIRRTLLYISISAIILAPLAIGLSLFLISHPTFFAVLEIENEFGIVLGILLILIIIISVTMIIAGIRHYRSIVVKWTKGYREFQREREEADRKIAEEYGIET